METISIDVEKVMLKSLSPKVAYDDYNDRIDHCSSETLSFGGNKPHH